MRKLTARERRTLTLMTNLACEWESTLAQANEPDRGTPNTDQRKSIESCQKNILRFRALELRLMESK
jgi:hypothetical protein